MLLMTLHMVYESEINKILMKKLTYIILMMTALCVACNKHHNAEKIEEDTVAKKELQGVWVNEDEEEVAFRIKADSVLFPDSTLMPVYFFVKSDTFYMCGANKVAYPIVKRTPHLFVFVNQNGEKVRLVKSSDESFLRMFSNKKVQPEINQNTLLKRDTIVDYADKRYHCYIQVNPTTYKVIKTSYNDDGVEVSTVYHDNIIHLSVYQGSEKVYSSNIVKKEFEGLVPQRFLGQTVLSDLIFDNTDKDGIHYHAVLAVPESMTSFFVEFIVGYNGRISKRVSNN